MPKSFNQKLKILYLLEILWSNTDEEHPLSMQQLLKKLDSRGIQAERKSIYDDFEMLRLFGMDVMFRKSSPSGYYLASRQFELPELKLLVDAVQASRFITEKKSQELIHKLENLASCYEATQLQRQVLVTGRIKSMNESIYYNVDRIHQAIGANCRITFQYYEWNTEGKMQLRKGGARYEVSPCFLTWDNENYYLVAFEEKSQKRKHYRVDKMLDIQVEEQKRTVQETPQEDNAARYTGKMFGMFSGKEQTVELQCKGKMAGVMMDRFGSETRLRPQKDGTFRLRVQVSVSDVFYGWLASLGTDVKVVKPKDVTKEYSNYLKQIVKLYK